MPNLDSNFYLDKEGVRTLINELETNVIAEEFSSSATYALGSYCIYENNLYRCTAAITTAGSWTGNTNWTQVLVTEDIKAISDKMDKTNPTGTGSFSLNRRANTTVGDYSFAEGSITAATGARSHAEGYYSTASGARSHAEGYSTIASGDNSHAEGTNTIANHKSQHVFGEHNIEDDSTQAATNRGNYVEIVGNGTAGNARSNARTLDWSGNEVLSGTIEATDFGTTLSGKIDTKISNELDIYDQNFANQYDSTTTYGLGDWCIYEHNLYQCTIAITTPEVWNSAHWTAKQITDLDLNDIQDVQIDSSTLTTGQALVYNNGHWENGEGGGGASSLDDLTDVTLTNPAANETLVCEMVSNEPVFKNKATTWTGTEAEYNAILVKDPNVTYYITDGDGAARYIICTQSQYNVWKSAGTLEADTPYYVTDANNSSIVIDDTVATADTVWSGYKTNQELALKQNVTDSSLTTSATTIVGAINEVNSGKVAKAGDTTTGAIIRSTTIDPATAPSDNKSFNVVEMANSNNEQMLRIETYQTSANTIVTQWCQTRKVNGSNVLNYFNLGIKSDGTKTVGISEPALWRSALGLAKVASTGSYTNLSDKPTIPTVNDGTLTIQKNGSTVATFTANSSSNKTANITVPKVVGGTLIISFNGSGYRDVALSAFSGLTSKPDSLILSAQSSRSCFIEYDWDNSGSTTLRIYGRQAPLAGGALSNLNGNVRVGWIAIDK